MAAAYLPWLAIGMGTLISPDHLKMWGNLAGAAGSGFWAAVLVAAAVLGLAAASYRRLADAAPDDGGYLEGLYRLGGRTAVALALASRVTLATGIATGVLVTAGFVFNETFVSWFPNFGIAFLGLTGVALSLLLGYPTAERVLAVLLAIALLGLTYLAIRGLWLADPADAVSVRTGPGVDPKTLAAGLLLFVGFDLGVHRGDGNRSSRTMPIILGSTLVLLGLWGSASLAHVPAERLADTTIPYTLAARRIGGQNGRILLGIVLVAGSLGAVTALFSATGRMVAQLARMRLLPPLFHGSDRRNGPAVILLAGTVAAMMGLGFAGSPHLELFIRAGFILWLLHLTLVHALAGVAGGGPQPAGRRTLPGLGRWAAFSGAVLLGAASIYLWLGDAARWPLLATLIAVWFGSGAVLAGGRKAAARRRRAPDNRASSGPL